VLRTQAELDEAHGGGFYWPAGSAALGR
jgi:hypothetical protein